MTQGKKFSPFFYNWITYAGAFLAILVALIEAFLFSLDFFSHQGDLYLGLLTYITLPPFLILGLAMIPLGAAWKRRRYYQGKTSLAIKPFSIDPSIPSHRNALFVFIVGTFIFVIMSLVGAYKAFHYTESVKFCGVLCHNVMDPEYTAYLQSPHGRVKCVECHIGSGADWYVRSKLSGARQVVKAALNTFERPIKTPVANLRPAEETCKQCHWPGKFFGTIDLKRKYFLTEGDDREWVIRMLLNVGGGKDQSAGVHAHMNLDHDIYYAAEDDRRQKITWIKSVDKSGRETIYVSPKSKWKDSPPAAADIRKMDCIDCHNRPAHQFHAPYKLLNDAMQYEHFNSDIPDIKQKGMEALSKKYNTKPEALETIRKDLETFYSANHAEYYASHKEEVGRAIEGIVALYQQNMFPEMKTRWDTHPDNIGHLTVPGCFRCHDGEHATLEGKIISKDCNACHVIVEQGPLGKTEKNIDGLEFRHPTDIGEDWKEANCNDCHSGGA